MRTRTRLTIAAVTGAALMAAGGAAFASTQAAAATTQKTASTSAASAFTWHRLHLINGWTALSSSVYGSPSYAVRDGVLYLSGILAAPKSGEPEFAVLPKGARPAHYLWISYMNFGGDDLGEMEIQPDGEMFANPTTSGGPVVDPSLAAISFPLSS
jgi:hypothetical protein